VTDDQLPPRGQSFRLVDQPVDRPVDEGSEELRQLLLDLDLVEVRDWAGLARQFWPFYARAASGDLEVSAQQRQLMDRIMDRGFGKAGSEPQELAAPGVVLLPLVGTDPVGLCPHCAAKFEESDAAATAAFREAIETVPTLEAG